MEYRSLEHKIRDLWIAEANRNTEIRRKVENVGRPKDNVKDETSKLGKQGEIQRKIVDEAADGDVGNKESDKKAKKDTDMDDMEAKTIKGGKTEVDTDPKTDDSTENSTDEDKKSKKATNKENKQIGAKGVKEETMTGKLTFGSSQSLIDSIAEAMKSMKGICPKCKKAKCMCEAWKEETVIEAVDHREFGSKGKMHPTMAKSMKVGQHADFYGHGTGDKHYGMVTKNTGTAVHVKTGGKTHKFSVSSNVEEETELEEKLVGNQKKIDANHNGKIDAEDFKILKARKMKEEVEDIDEVLDTADKKATYFAKAKSDIRKNSSIYGTSEKNKKVIRKRESGMDMAAKKMAKEEVEQIDEISLKTKINAYKATRDHDADYSYGGKVHDQGDRIHKNIVAKHGAKAGEHADRAAYGKPSTPATRSAEKAKPDLLKRDSTHPMRTTKSGVAHKQDQKSNANIIKSRLGKHGKSNVPEEVEFSEAELARIEEIAASIDEVVTARKLTPADKAARAKYLEGHAAKMAGMAHHAIKGDAKSFKARNTEHGDYSKEPSKMAGIGLDHTLTKQDTKR